QPASRSGVELVNGAVVDRNVLVLIQAGRVIDPIGPVGVRVEREAHSPAMLMRLSTHRVRRYAHPNRAAASKIHHTEWLSNHDLHVDVTIQVARRYQECSWVLVLAVADNRLQ